MSKLNILDTSKKMFAKKFKDLFAFSEITDKTKSAPKAQIDALSQQSTVSQLVFYRYAEEVRLSNGEKKTLYTVDDGRKGFVLEVTPPVFLGDDNEKDMHDFFNSFYTENSANAIVHINTFASRNIDKFIEAYKEVHDIDGVDVKRRDILKELIEKRVEAYRTWANEPMGRNGAKLRNFVNTISVLFPKETSTEEIMDVYVNSENVLTNYNARDMKPDKLIATLSEFIRPDDLVTENFCDVHQEMNAQICTGSKIKLSQDDGYFDIGEEWKGITLTTEKFPKEISIFEFQSAFFDPFGKEFKMALPCPFVCSLVISFEDAEKNAKKTVKKAQHNIGQIHIAPDKLEKQRPIIKHKREENENIVKYISEYNEFPLKAMWSLTVFDNNMPDLKRNCSLIKKKFKEMSYGGDGWILKEESYSPVSFQSMLMGFPLQHSKIVNDNLKRFRVLFKSNNSQIAPLISGNKGFGKPVLMLPDRTGQIMTFDFYESKKNYNIAIIGPSGSGKSYLMNEISRSYLTAGSIIRLVDIGDSYKDVTNSLGGRFIEFDDESNLCLNFFTNMATREDIIEDKKIIRVHEDELTTIIPIVGNMLKMDLKSSHSQGSNSYDDLKRKAIVSILEESIQTAFERQGRAAGMQTVWDYLKELRERFFNKQQENICEMLDFMILGLQDYVVRTDENGNVIVGKSATYFNGVNNLEFDSDLFCFEMEKLTKKGDDLLEIVSMVVLHQMANEAYFLKGRRKLIGVDEAARLIKKPIFVEFLDDLSRRLRKYGGLLIIVTQYIKDFFQNKSAEVMFEGASFKIFLAQENESIDEAVDTGKLSMNDGVVALMKSVETKAPYYNEFLIRHGSSNTIVLNKVDVLSNWLYTTSESDKSKIHELETRYTLKGGEGAWMMSLITEGMQTEDAYQEILAKRSKNL